MVYEFYDLLSSLTNDQSNNEAQILQLTSGKVDKFKFINLCIAYTHILTDSVVFKFVWTL